MATLTGTTNAKAFSRPARPDSVRVICDGALGDCGCGSHSDSRRSRSALSEHIFLATD